MSHSKQNYRPFDTLSKTPCLMPQSLEHWEVSLLVRQASFQDIFALARVWSTTENYGLKLSPGKKSTNNKTRWFAFLWFNSWIIFLKWTAKKNHWYNPFVLSVWRQGLMKLGLSSHLLYGQEWPWTPDSLASHSWMLILWDYSVC